MNAEARVTLSYETLDKIRALKKELQEELGIKISDHDVIAYVIHQYLKEHGNNDKA